jgi:NADH-quinone oxidoreductase subunit L
MNSTLPWVVLLAPLVSAALITIFTLRGKNLSSAISCAAILVSFICASIVFARRDTMAATLTWMAFPGVFTVPFALLLDPLSRMMLVLVSGIGTLIHLYSLGYMRDDEGKSRYFAALSLFMFAMLGIVVADNFVMLFIFWELVGFTSYVLIGHWFGRDAAADAAKKAFITTRLGDFGFMTGILVIWMATGSVVFSDIGSRLPMLSRHPVFLTLTALLIFCGAIGKSAQFPLHVWLPDAMEGPTPISALIHAATMVAAGVYMLVRVGFIIQTSATALLIIAWVGTITAVMAALIATQQNDIKRILAFAARLYGDGGRACFRQRGDFPSLHACVFQGAALPCRWVGHHRAASRAGYLGNGRSEQNIETHIHDVSGRWARADGLSAVQRFLQQGRDSCARLRTQCADLHRRSSDSVFDRLLRYPPARDRVLWSSAQPDGTE